MTRPKILLLGCGGIGGTMAARLIAHGEDLAIVTHNPAIAAAVTQRGITVRYEDRTETVAASAAASIHDVAGPFDFVLLATPPAQVEAATHAALPLLAEGGVIVCFQNGLCEQRVAAIAGPSRTVGAIVAWGASMLEPGVYERTSDGGFTIGRLDGSTNHPLDGLRRLLQSIGPVEVTRNLRGARWSKLAINCAISSLGTIGGERLGVLLRFRFVRRLALEVMTEAVLVAQARGVRLEKVAGTIDLVWVALRADERQRSGSPSLLAKHALLLAVGAKFRRLRSSMLIAIERGREPAVDYLNGEVVIRAQALAIPTPINTRVQAMIHAIARGTLQPGLPLLRQLYAETREIPPRPRASGPRFEDTPAPPAS